MTSDVFFFHHIPHVIMASVSNVRKRRRFSSTTFVQRANRPIDKVLPGVNMLNLVNVQVTQDLVTAATACTATGIRWSLNAISTDTADVGIAAGAWAIIILRDSRTAQTMSFTAGSNLYEPEQDVLSFGRWLFSGKGDATGVGPGSMHFSGETKTMRKLKIGDKLSIIALGGAGAVEMTFSGTVQIFCKF